MKKRIDLTQDTIINVGQQSADLSEWIGEVEQHKSSTYYSTMIPLELTVLISLTQVASIAYDWEIPLGLCWRGGGCFV